MLIVVDTYTWGGSRSHFTRDVLEEYGRHLSRIARTLFAAMARNLDLDLHAGDSRREHYLSDKTGDFRVYRYPRCPNGEDVGWGLESHTDSSVISVLTQDADVCGLEVLRDDRWLAVKPVLDTLTINLGDMMQVRSFISHRLYCVFDLNSINVFLCKIICLVVIAILKL